MCRSFCRWAGWIAMAGAGLPLWATDDLAPQSAVLRVQITTWLTSDPQISHGPSEKPPRYLPKPE
jgi:hypothetical protein